MIKIEVRENKVFEIGYPYNSSVDSYFQSLTEDFIKNYGLDSDTVTEINNHKNNTLSFDRKLHDFIISLSTFMVEFENNGQVLINVFEELIEKRKELELTKKTLNSEKENSEKEYNFILDNIQQLNSDIEKVEEFINYYNSQIYDDSYSYSDNYVNDTQNAIILLEDIIQQNESEFDYYKNTLYEHIISYVSIRSFLKDYTFTATTLRSMYEEWQRRPELFYQNLVNYFEDEYNQYWTYGSSLIYGEKLKDENASKIIFKKIASRWQETLFKRYHFAIEKEVKEYSLNWLDNHTSFDEKEFFYAIESKKVEIFTRELYEVEQLVIDKRQAVKNVIPYEKEQNYYKYREYVLAKRKYLYQNVNIELDQNIIDEYDSQITSLQGDYDFVINKFSQPTYWEYYSEFEMYTELVTDLKLKLSRSEQAISREYTKLENNDNNILDKIAFYTSEKEDLEAQLIDLHQMREKLEIENNIRNDEITLNSSRFYENESLILDKRNEYEVLFNERLQFFMYDSEINENENIIFLLEGNFFNELDSLYENFKNYSVDVEWYSYEDREKLILFYENLLTLIKENFEIAWNKEFSQNILNTKKINVYEYYFDKELRKLYAMINKHLLDGVYDSMFITLINEQSNKVRSIFMIYVEIAFDINENITLVSNMFDYDEVLEFTISDGNENIENVIETFDTIINDIVTFAYNKNIEFKVFEESVDKLEKIDQVWLDMEKSYV